MTTTEVLDFTALSEAGIDAERAGGGIWTATDAQGFEIEFGRDATTNDWFALSEAGAPHFAALADLLAYVREFIETPADL